MNPLRRKRILSQISGEALAAKAQVSRSTISNIERGVIHPGPAELARIDACLDDLITAKQKVAEFASVVGWNGAL
jgi:transcriptional regulator with XRE-family HTH domain